MDIPREAVLAAAQARLGPVPRLEDMSESAVAYELNKAEEQLEAAEALIARAAQVAILREVVAELRRASWTSADPAEAEVAKGVALAIGRTIERKAEALEAGNV